VSATPIIRLADGQLALLADLIAPARSLLADLVRRAPIAKWIATGGLRAAVRPRTSPPAADPDQPRRRTNP
jgi:hypothetical protein